MTRRAGDVPDPSALSPKARRNGQRTTLLALGVYLLSSALALLAGAEGIERLRRPADAQQHHGGYAGFFAYGNGLSYAEIAREGYSYVPGDRSNVAFFPVYPVLGRAVARVTGWSAELALVVVSYAALAGAFVLFDEYLAARLKPCDEQVARYSLLALGFFPPGVFFRVAYSESVFLLLAMLCMTATQRRWPLVLCAALVGLATAARPVGVVLLVPLAMHVWKIGGPLAARAVKAAVCVSLGCWGLLSFMAFQYAAFGDALAFAHAHEQWRNRPPATWHQELTALLTLEPLWSVYLPNGPTHWRTADPESIAVFSLQFANPLYFALAAVLVAVGAWKRWLNGPETALAAGLLLMPYVTRSFDMGMTAGGRFTAVAFPIYIVMGQIAVRSPVLVRVAVLAASAVLLVAYAARFSAAYPLF